MKPRKLPLGDMNIVGANITRIRLGKNIKQKELLAKLQIGGDGYYWILFIQD